MVHFSLLSAAAGILTAASVVSATPVPSNPSDQPRAFIVPFVNKHAAARRSMKYERSQLIKRDLRRVQERNEGAALKKPLGVDTVQVKRTAAAPEPYDINILRKARMKKRQSFATAPLVENNDSFYGNINIGTPAQTITVDFDMSTGYVIVPTAECTNCTGPFFDPSLSTSHATTSQPFQAELMYGEVATAVTSADTVAIGSLSVSNQALWLITQAEANFAPVPFSGVMGLAFPIIAEDGSTPWFMNLASQGLLESNIFSFYLPVTPQGSNGSELCVGCLDGAKFTGQPEYFPLTPGDSTQRSWDIAAQGFTLNGNVFTTQPMTVTIDSNLPGAVLPHSEASAFYANVPGAQLAANGWQWTFPCANVGQLQVGIMFSSSTVFNLNPADLVFNNGSDICTGNILSSNSEDGKAKVGSALMSTWYSIFDYGNMRIGFAQAV
ncbi:hypothetical protein FRC01_009921 [Tulasnella sp. 417]|nr:hypothetical protein FRC01_009921 [Tulasnella sp. 417]